MKAFIVLLCCAVGLVGLGCSSDDGGTADDVLADTSAPDCALWNWYADVDPDAADPCEPGTDLWRACTSGAAGAERCVYVVTGEDQGVHRWGPCEEACSEAEVGSSRACEVNGVVGVEYCGDALSRDDHLWQGCQPATCVACTPGDTRLCGPGTNYPDTVIPCLLSDGVPYWAEGDCST